MAFLNYTKSFRPLLVQQIARRGIQKIMLGGFDDKWTGAHIKKA